MALGAGDKAIVQSWTGPVDPSEEDAVDEAVTRLGSPYAAALEILMIDRGAMAREASKSSSGDDRSDHTANMKWIDDQISELVAFVQGESTITFVGAAEVLLSSASGADTDSTKVVTLSADNSRRG
jgi:hypothetical protein